MQDRTSSKFASILGDSKMKWGSQTPRPALVWALVMHHALTPRENRVLPGDNSGATVAPVQIDLTGKTLGDFHVLRRLGQGGMGQVYLAEQISLKRKVALKLLKAELAGNSTSLQRFKAEAEAVARATHANIVQVYAIGECDGLHY